ncbi:MAG: hypothetical protein WBV43_02205 [Pseudolabrys sp.]
MATEPAPAEINLREPRKRGRDFSALLWLGGWGVATAVALSALAITSQTQTATDRLRSIFAVSEPSADAQMPPRVAQLELETQMLTEQVRAKANFGPLLSNLHPLAAPERRQGKTGYRLVVGPLPNSPAATGLCAHFNAAHTPCRAVRFEGEQIAQG